MPIVWVKDGHYYDNGLPPGGFSLQVTMEKLSDIGSQEGLVHGLQGEYHCEVWDQQGQKRAKSNTATVLFKDVITFQGTIRIPNHPFNATLHSKATLLFSPSHRAGLEYYQQMIYFLTMFNISNLDFPHAVTIKSYRQGSLVIDFTLYYELPTTDIQQLLTIFKVTLKYHQDPRLVLDENIRLLVEDRIRKRLENKRSSWVKRYSKLGLTNADIYLLGTTTCTGDVTEWNGRRIEWPVTPVGTGLKSRQKCLDGQGRSLGQRQCVGNFRSGVRLNDPVYIQSCAERESRFTDRLRKLSEVEVINTNTEAVIDDLKYLVGDSSELISEDFVYISYILGNVALAEDIDIKSVRTIFNIVSNWLEMNDTLLSEANKLDQAKNRISWSMEEIGLKIQTNGTAVQSIIENNLLLSIHDMTYKPSKLMTGLAILGNPEIFTAKDMKHFNPYLLDIISDLSLGIVLPKELINMSNRNTGSRGSMDDNKVVFTLYHKTDLFEIDRTLSRFKHHRSCGTAVAASVVEGHVHNLSEPVLMFFKIHDVAAMSAVTCVYWNYTALDGQGDWSDYGCRVNATDGTTVVCACNHLTTFSALIDTRKYSSTISGGRVLNLVLIIGLSISIAALGLTIFTIILFRKLRRCRAQKLLFFVALTELLTNIVLWIGTDLNLSEIPCAFFAAVFHYFIMATFTWILIDSVLCFLMIMKDPVFCEGNLILKISIPAWVFPAVVIGIVTGVDHYVYQSLSTYCWLGGIPLYMGFFLPCGLIFLVIIILSFTGISKRISGKNDMFLKAKDIKYELSPQHFVSNIAVTVLLGVTWTVGFFMFEYNTPLLEYIFAVSNGLCGLTVFFSSLLREPYLCRNATEYLQCCKRQKAESSPASSVGTLSSKIDPNLQNSIHLPEKGNIYIVYPHEVTLQT